MENNVIPVLRFPEFTDQWNSDKLGSIATFSKGKGISKADIQENGATECIRYGELYTVYSEVISEIKSKTNLDVENLVLSDANDVIIPASGETKIDIATASCVLKAGVALSGDLNIIKSKTDGVFLSYYLNNAKKYKIARLAQGISVVHLYSSQLASLNVNIPSPEEQIKIATFLMAVDKRIKILEKKKNDLEQYKKGVMQKLFSRIIRFKKDDGSDFIDWEVKKLGTVFNSFKGQGLSKDKIDENGENECILYGELYTTYSEVIKSVQSKTNVEEGIKSEIGDLLVPCSTTTTGIDLANVTALNKAQVLLGGDISILRAIERINSIFFAYYLSNHKKYDLAKYGQGTTIVHLYYNHFKVMNIEVPEYEEQERIADFLISIDKSINKIVAQIAESIVFKKGLLQKMFV